MLLHTGERPCKPKFFDNAYRNKNDHNIHMLYHIGEKPYRCDICDEPFCNDKELIIGAFSTRSGFEIFGSVRTFFESFN